MFRPLEYSYLFLYQFDLWLKFRINEEAALLMVSCFFKLNLYSPQSSRTPSRRPTAALKQNTTKIIHILLLFSSVPTVLFSKYYINATLFFFLKEKNILGVTTLV